MTIILEKYSARRAAALSGFQTVAMIDYLQRSGVFYPKGKKGSRGRGRARTYEFRDVLVLKAIKRLLDSGASVSALRKALEEFQKIQWVADPATMEHGQGIVRYMVASVDGIHLAENADMLINLSKKGQLAFSFIIDLERLHGEICADLGLPKYADQPELKLEANRKSG